ncbi:MAG TPA: hypothetical protein VGO78_17320, partial [Acidimicrobiales bacterium]|nr:hypothetical protein [Acidimicrobiales bacterium]
MATVSAADRRRARLVAEAVVADASAAGLSLPPDLALWDLAGWGSAPPRDAVARRAGGVLADVLEDATPDAQRRVNGLHVTP